MCLYIQWVCSTEAATSRGHNALLNLGQAAERKRCIYLSRSDQIFWEKVSHWHQETPLCRYTLILLTVRGFLRSCHFCLFCLFFSVFYCLFNPYKFNNAVPHSEIYCLGFILLVFFSILKMLFLFLFASFHNSYFLFIFAILVSCFLS